MSPRASGSPVPLSSPCLGEEEREAVAAVLRSGRLVQGPKVEAFEEAFARLTKSPHAVAVSSGTAALLLSLHGLGVGPGCEVILPAYTYVATANVVSLAGATPVLADVESHSMNLDPASVVQARGPRTGAVLPVHQFGRVLDVSAVARAARAANCVQFAVPSSARRAPDQVVVLEDAACAVGAHAAEGMHQGQAACFSFHQRKIVTTGEGGMVTTPDGELARRIRALRQHGFGPEGDCTRPGFNFRMTEMAAAMGLVQLERLPGMLAARQSAANLYHQLLSGFDWLVTPGPAGSATHVFQSYVVRVRPDAPLSRDALMQHLADRGIQTQAGVLPVHQQSAHRQARRVPLPVSEELGTTALFLPMFAGLSQATVERICAAIKEAQA